LTNSAQLAFIETDPESHFPLQNLPFGVFEHPVTGEARCATAIGKYLVDLRELEEHNLFEYTKLRGNRVFTFSTLDLFLSLGTTAWRAARARLSELLSGDDPALERDPGLREKVFHLREDVKMLMPVRIADVTVSLNSLHYLRNLQSVFNQGNELEKMLQQLPVFRHGRPSSVFISGTGLNRPYGPRQLPGEKNFSISPTRMLDVELCTGFVTGKGNPHGMSMSVKKAEESIFGHMLVLNWIARDFHAVNSENLNQKPGFHLMSTISPWIVTTDALESLRFEKEQEETGTMRHLRAKNEQLYDIRLEMVIDAPGQDKSAALTNTNTRYLHWSPAQELAHRTVTGARGETGELFISGPVSGPERAYSSLMEITADGKELLVLPTGEERMFLRDGDRIRAGGYGKAGSYRIGFGEVSGHIEGAF
jgi:fumarylacetoacetase